MDKDKEQIDLENDNEEFDWDAFFEEEPDQQWEEEKKRRKKRKSFIVKIVGSLLALSLLISGIQIWFQLFNIPAINFLEASSRLSKNPEVVEYKKSIVTIESDGSKGTGFNIDPDGLIVTNAHVVDTANKVRVYFKSGGSYVGEVVSVHTGLDLALVDIDAENIPALPISYDEDWEQQIGDDIIFIGNPLAFTQIANEGTIANKVLVQDLDVPVMMIDAPIYKGNSGSPVINQKGEVVGVIFATISSEERYRRVGVATPSFYLKKLLDNK
jgi:serine protease Do